MIVLIHDVCPTFCLLGMWYEFVFRKGAPVFKHVKNHAVMIPSLSITPETLSWVQWEQT